MRRGLNDNNSNIDNVYNSSKPLMRTEEERRTIKRESDENRE